MYNEIAIIKKCQAGNEAAFETIISFYYPNVIRFLSGFNVDRNLIEDIAQETFIKLIRNIEKYDIYGKARFSTYIFTIARHCAIDEMRRHKHMNFNIDELENMITAEHTIEDTLLQRIRETELEEAISDLPHIQQITIRLRYFENLSLKEIGDHTGVADKTVKSRLHRALISLRKKIGKGEKE